MQNKKYKLIASDLDGTLLDDNSKLSARNKSAILKAVESGVIFVPTTGRPPKCIDVVTSIIDEDIPCITFNGAMACMSKSEKVFFSKYLDLSLAKEIYDIGLKRDLQMVLWTGSKLWTNKICKATLDYSNISSTSLTVTDNLNNLGDKGILKMLWIDTPENVAVFQSEMNEYFGNKLNCHSSLPIFLEFVSPDATKGNAIAEIGKEYGIDKSKMIVIGDGYNDISMIEYAGLGVSVANAPDEIKAVSDYVTLSNNEDGVAVVIEKFVL